MYIGVALSSLYCINESNSRNELCRSFASCSAVRTSKWALSPWKKSNESKCCAYDLGPRHKRHLLQDLGPTTLVLATKGNFSDVDGPPERTGQVAHARYALPYAEDEHPRRIRGPVTDHELDQFRKDRLQLRKAGGTDRSTNELFRSLNEEELPIVREWADRVLDDTQSASSVLTDEVLN